MNIISREAWGAVPPTSIETIGPVGTVYAHTQARVIDQSMTPEQEAAVMRGIQRFHMAPDDPATPDLEGRDFSDIAYSFVIFPSGRVYEGRGWGRAHGGNRGEINFRSVSFCFAGHGDTQHPTAAAFEAFRQLRALGKELGRIELSDRVLGHTDDPGVTKSCPGHLIHPRLDELRLPPQGEEDTMAVLTDTEAKKLMAEVALVAAYITNLKEAGSRAEVVDSRLDRIPDIEQKVLNLERVVLGIQSAVDKLVAGGGRGPNEGSGPE